jgi:hypothetical protein
MGSFGLLGRKMGKDGERFPFGSACGRSSAAGKGRSSVAGDGDGVVGERPS